MKGAIENCCRAEQEIMKKVREAYENDVAAMSVSIRHLCLPCSEPEPQQSESSMWAGHGMCCVALEHLFAFGIRFIGKRLLTLIIIGVLHLIPGVGLSILGFELCDPPVIVCKICLRVHFSGERVHNFHPIFKGE